MCEGLCSVGNRDSQEDGLAAGPNQPATLNDGADEVESEFRSIPLLAHRARVLRNESWIGYRDRDRHDFCRGSLRGRGVNLPRPRPALRSLRDRRTAAMGARARALRAGSASSGCTSVVAAQLGQRGDPRPREADARADAVRVVRTLVESEEGRRRIRETRTAAVVRDREVDRHPTPDARRWKDASGQRDSAPAGLHAEITQRCLVVR